VHGCKPEQRGVEMQARGRRGDGAGLAREHALVTLAVGGAEKPALGKRADGRVGIVIVDDLFVRNAKEQWFAEMKVTFEALRTIAYYADGQADIGAINLKKVMDARNTPPQLLVAIGDLGYTSRHLHLPYFSRHGPILYPCLFFLMPAGRVEANC
jgi:hypothetical protein